jgi:hypothetical protein
MYIILVVTLAGCATFATEVSYEGPIEIGEIFAMKYGQRREIQNTGLTIEINKISDSRCPLNAQCIRKGDISVTLDIFRNNEQVGSAHMFSGLTPQERKVGEYKNLNFYLLDLYPYPMVGYSVKHSIAVMSITKNLT